MKLRHLLYFVIPMSMVMSACQSDDEINDDTPPEGALPSVEFTPNNLPEGPYAEDAIRIIANNEYNSPFYSIELTPDGHYVLMEYEPHYMYSNGATSVSVKAKNDGSFMMRKNVIPKPHVQGTQLMTTVQYILATVWNTESSQNSMTQDIF